MMLIYNLTEDWTRIEGGERKVRGIRHVQFVRAEQILTEQGICYIANNYLASNMSTR